MKSAIYEEKLIRIFLLADDFCLAYYKWQSQHRCGVYQLSYTPQPALSESD